jgi:hypothetical protein
VRVLLYIYVYIAIVTKHSQLQFWISTRTRIGFQQRTFLSYFSWDQFYTLAKIRYANMFPSRQYATYHVEQDIIYQYASLGFLCQHVSLAMVSMYYHDWQWYANFFPWIWHVNVFPWIWYTSQNVSWLWLFQQFPLGLKCQYVSLILYICQHVSPRYNMPTYYPSYDMLIRFFVYDTDDDMVPWIWNICQHIFSLDLIGQHNFLDMKYHHVSLDMIHRTTCFSAYDMPT